MRIERLQLKKLNNTRDLGGFPADGGKTVKYGRLIRSGRLYKIPKSTKKALENMHVTTVVDMRIERERLDYPCVHLEGSKEYTLPLACIATPGITYTKSMARTVLNESKRIKDEFGTADEYMKKVYSILLFSDHSKEQLKKFFDLVIADEHCILWHCNAGKDRTGLSAMLLESVLGVDEELVVEDYCASKVFQSRMRFWQKCGLVVAPVPRRFKQILIALMEAKPQYIRGAIAEIKEKYGTVTEYCKQALGLTENDIQFLKDKYLE